MEAEWTDAESDSFATWVMWALGIVVALWIFFGLMAIFGHQIVRLISPRAAESIQPGTFGDMFGAGNAFFSALAFAFVVITLRLQVKELKEARLDRKTNLQHQHVIAKSQEAAAKMQLKLAQSGDVYKAYSRVYGSDFNSRYFRLCWLFRDLEQQEGNEETIRDFLRLGPLGRHLHQRASGIPARYNPSFVGLYSEGHRVNRGEVVAQRVHEDIEACADAIVDLWPAYHMGLLDMNLLALNEEFVSESPMRSFQRVHDWLAVICPADRGRLGVIELFVKDLSEDWHRWMKEEFDEDWEAPP